MKSAGPIWGSSGHLFIAQEKTRFCRDLVDGGDDAINVDCDDSRVGAWW